MNEALVVVSRMLNPLHESDRRRWRAAACTWLLGLLPVLGWGQSAGDSATIRRFYDAALAEGQSYELLRDLVTLAPARLSGSANAEKAVQWGKARLEAMGFDRVWLQAVTVPKWVRGEREQCYIAGRKREPLAVLALGNSEGTGPQGVEAEVVEVRSLAELAELGEARIRGRIVFFNRPMEPRNVNTFQSYSQAGDQRRRGPSAAAQYGAVAVLVRSLSLFATDLPHTGSTSYDTSVSPRKIAAAALSTQAADRLSAALKAEPKLRVYLRTTSGMQGEAPSHNVVAEIRGSEKPEEIVVVGGHLDSWDVAQGAHDDGAGCVQSMEALRLFRQLGIRPKRTIRAVLFMNEENGLRGGLKYAELAASAGERHIAAIESDNGGFVPRGFGIGGKAAQQDRILRWAPLFAPYQANEFVRGGGGADIGPLAAQGTVTIGLRPDSQRYFTIHHNANDNLDQVNPRELALGAGAMASLLWLLSEYGVD